MQIACRNATPPHCQDRQPANPYLCSAPLAPPRCPPALACRLLPAGLPGCRSHHTISAWGAQAGGEDDETSSSGDEDDGSDADMADAPAAVGMQQAERQHIEPVVDDDGFELVQRRGRRR